MKLSRVIFGPVAKILLIDAAAEMKVSFITCEKNKICRGILKDIVLGAFLQFLNNH